MENQKKFIKAFKQIKSLGFVKSNRPGSTGIGKTLEDIMNIKENNIDAPDLHGYEIKSQRMRSTSLVTLFTKAPTYPAKVNNELRMQYGSPDSKFPDIKVLHSSIFATNWNTHKAGFSYRLQVDRDDKKLRLLVKRTDADIIDRSDIYWDFSVFEKIFSEKLQNLAFVEAETKKDDEGEYFHFQRCCLFSGITLSSFLDNVERGNVMFDIRVGAYKNKASKSYGKTHDHGTGFRVKRDIISQLYPLAFEV